jgi:hypothetical protein
MQLKIKQVVGWIGVILIAFAYFYMTYLCKGAADKFYFSMNLFGAASVVYVSWKNNWQSVSINVFFFLVSLFGLCSL